MPAHGIAVLPIGSADEGAGDSSNRYFYKLFLPVPDETYAWIERCTGDGAAVRGSNGQFAYRARVTKESGAMATDQGMGAMPHMGMEVCTADGATVGTVKEMQGRYFKVDAPMKPDFWLTTDCIRTASANTVTLTVDKDHLGDVKTDLPSQREAQTPYTTTTTEPPNSASRPTATGSVAGADMGTRAGAAAGETMHTDMATEAGTRQRGPAEPMSGSTMQPQGAIALLMQMHTEAKTQFMQILNSSSGDQAEMRWRKLEPVLKLHEEMEERYLYDPLKQEQGSGTELGDWEPQHEHEVEQVNALIAQADNLSPSDDRWLPQIRQIRDTLARHIDEEETMIFPRIQQVWGRDRLEQAGQQMQQMMQQQLGSMGSGGATI